jgi:hypothetical protein
MILSRPSVNRALSKYVLWRDWILFHGNSGSGKTLGMHLFIRNQLHTGSAADDVDVSRSSSIKVPITCRMELRNCSTKEMCMKALRDALGLSTIIRPLCSICTGSVVLFVCFS